MLLNAFYQLYPEHLWTFKSPSILKLMQMHLMYVLRPFVLFQHLILFSGWLHIKYLVFFMLIILDKH